MVTWTPRIGRVVWQVPDGYDAEKTKFRVFGYRPCGVRVGLYTINDWKSASNAERKEAREDMVWQMLQITMRNDDMTPLCWLCGSVSREKAKGTESSELLGGLFVDHDHATGIVRGLICPTCNRVVDQLRASAFWTPALECYLDGPRATNEWDELVAVQANGSAPLYCSVTGALGDDADSWAWPPASL